MEIFMIGVALVSAWGLGYVFGQRSTYGSVVAGRLPAGNEVKQLAGSASEDSKLGNKLQQLRDGAVNNFLDAIPEYFESQIFPRMQSTAEEKKSEYVFRASEVANGLGYSFESGWDGSSITSSDRKMFRMVADEIEKILQVKGLSYSRSWQISGYGIYFTVKW